MKFMKRGQMEMVGLVIIVILITLGMLFMAKFALKNESTKKIFVRESLAHSTMNALARTEAKCLDYGDYRGITEKRLAIEAKLLEDCAEHYNDPNFSYFKCDNKPSCTFLNETIRHLLNQTLGTWKKHYEFSSTLISGDQIVKLITIKDQSKKGCPGERDASEFPLFTDVGLVKSTLFICD